MKCPCKDCEHRTITCHGQCDEYKAWKSYAENRNAWLRGFKPHTSENLKKREKENIMKRHRGWYGKWKGGGTE